MTSDSLPVAVVLVTWNSADVLEVCLGGLAGTRPPPAELIVVDNASEDRSLAIVEAFAARTSLDVRTVRHDVNRGFAAAANRGIAETRAPFVLLLNPDVRLLPTTLAELHASLALAPADVAVAGGKLLRAEGDQLAPTTIIDSTGIVMTTSGRHFDRGAGERDLEQWDGLGEVFGITGAAALFRRDALHATTIDGEVFDEDFFAYREDVDLAWRLRGMGYRALYDPEAIAYHRRTVLPERRRQLSRAINFHSVKNRFLLRIHHADPGWMLRFGLSSLLRDVVVVGACLSIEWSSLPAFVWLLRALPRHWRRRREILARRKVASRELQAWFHRVGSGP